MVTRRQKIRRTLWAKQLQIEECKSIYLSPSDLRAFGIQASQVDLADDGLLHFEPRFFELHPERVLEKYPIDAAKNDDDIRRLHCIPTLQDAMDTIQANPPAAEDPLGAAQKLLKERLERFHYWDEDRFRWSWDYLDYELDSLREGGPPIFCLSDIAGLQKLVCGIYEHTLPGSCIYG